MPINMDNLMPFDWIARPRLSGAEPPGCVENARRPGRDAGMRITRKPSLAQRPYQGAVVCGRVPLVTLRKRAENKKIQVMTRV
jgi:hypothetical protein